jgi:hypothetical protein
MSILIPSSFFFLLVCVPENLFFSHIESAVLGSYGLGMEVSILPKSVWLTMIFNNQALKWTDCSYIRQMHLKLRKVLLLFWQHTGKLYVFSTRDVRVRQCDSYCGLNYGTA